MRVALAGLLLIALAGPAGANGRDPYAQSITFRQGSDRDIVAGMTFGTVFSHDGGTTWQWMCERVIGYSGMFDPDYVYAASGTVFATSFIGLRAMRDGCSFVTTPAGPACNDAMPCAQGFTCLDDICAKYASRVEGGSDGALYFTATDPFDTKIYKSTDDGVTWPTSAMPGLDEDWWQSMAVAPSDPNRIYLTGHRLFRQCTPNSSNPGAACQNNTDCPGGMCEPQKQFLMFKRTTNVGFTFTPMTTTGITPTSTNSSIEIVGISATNPDTLYVKVTLETGTTGESIYRSTDAGATWTKILPASVAPSNFGISFVARANGTCVVGTRELGAWQSTDCATAATPTWTALTGAPHIGCLVENGAGEVWACTQNYGSPVLGITSDGYGIMKSSDLVTWTGVLQFEAIQAPVACAAGTVQEDRCVQRYMDTPSQWCCLAAQLGITSTAIDCAGALACFQGGVDGAPDAGTTRVKPPESCCDTGSGSSALLSLLVAGALLLRPRRSKEK